VNPFRRVRDLLDMASNEKKVALITGAYKGIGLETARQLGELGIAVIVSARDQQKADGAAEKLKAEKVTAYGVKLDATNAADYKSVSDFIESKFGKLDILVNNAGVMRSKYGVNDTSTTPEEDLRETFDSNFFGPIALTQALLPLLRKAEAGRIVNVSSILGSLNLHSDPSSPIYAQKSFAYNASKTALNAYTVHLAHELRDTKIKVNSAHPGWVKTDLGTDAAPMGTEEGAKTEVALATLPESGPTGSYSHLGKTLPW
jgi:NAD(P)-dependent dehydrogenase (short-subunit alcohol dehydrogenase family)